MLTKEQIANRVNFIGASDCSGVLGLSHWESPLSIWGYKTKLLEPPDLSDVLAVELGNELEDFVARRFEKETGKKVERVDETLFHPKFTFIGANLDRIVVGEDAVLECKTTSAWKEKDWVDEEIPQEYILQVLHQLAVSGKKKVTSPS